MCHTRRGPYANALGRRACSRRSTLRLNFELRLKRSNQSKRKMSLNPVKKPWKKAAALGLYHSGFGVSSLSLEFSGSVSPPLRDANPSFSYFKTMVLGPSQVRSQTPNSKLQTPEPNSKLWSQTLARVWVWSFEFEFGVFRPCVPPLAGGALERSWAASGWSLRFRMETETTPRTGGNPKPNPKLGIWKFHRPNSKRRSQTQPTSKQAPRQRAQQGSAEG